MFQKELEWLFTVLALCHTVHIDRLHSPTHGGENGRSDDGRDYDYQSSSPDEKALVEASAKYGPTHSQIVFVQLYNNFLSVTL